MTGARIGAWVQASRPLAQANLAPALLLGQALCFSLHGTFSLRGLFVAQLFGVLDQLFILFVNDYADVESDALNDAATAYSGGSRVVQQGKLTRQELGRAAVWVLLALVGSSAAVGWLDRNPALPGLTLAGVALVWAYSLPPLRLAYRGHGEILQALGVGVLLPAFGYAVQHGSLDGLPPAAYLAGALLGYAGNITTSLPDQEADTRSDKRSYAVRRGQRRARIESLGLLGLGTLVAALALPGLPDGFRVATLVLGLGAAALNLPLLRGCDTRRGPSVVRFVVQSGAAITLSMLVPAIGLALGARG